MKTAVKKPVAHHAKVSDHGIYDGKFHAKGQPEWVLKVYLLRWGLRFAWCFVFAFGVGKGGDMILKNIHAPIRAHEEAVAQR